MHFQAQMFNPKLMDVNFSRCVCFIQLQDTLTNVKNIIRQSSWVRSLSNHNRPLCMESDVAETLVLRQAAH